jgi:putative endonuclease
MVNNKELGNLGESIACDYLLTQGYHIIQRNFSCKVGELDIIASDNDVLVFIEVKTRTSDRFGLPSEAVSYSKQKKIAKTALSYIAYKKLFDYMSRFDVIEVSIDEAQGTHQINLIKDAFQYSGKYGY